mmetsp:Transcript_46289/g.53346  ORF Transcript_46289/g.53346 Transcript_46289/m.53346 type:complete len:669 (+) Transcript_46289:30-2036(+)
MEAKNPQTKQPIDTYTTSHASGVRPSKSHKSDPKRAKKRQKTDLSHIYQENLPNGNMYELSYMHKTTVTDIVMSESTHFLITSSQDGNIKFWKKDQELVEFVKNYQAHNESICAIALSGDGTRLVTSGVDSVGGSEDDGQAVYTVKLFDVVAFDMISIKQVDFVPHFVEFVSNSDSLQPLIAVGSRDSQDIQVFKAEESDAERISVFSHVDKVQCLKYNEVYDVVISADQKGIIDYWDPRTGAFPKDQQAFKFDFKSDTDLFKFLEIGSVPSSISLSRDGRFFAMACSDKTYRVFGFLTGKLIREFNESNEVILHNQTSPDGPRATKLEKKDFDKRMKVERDFDKHALFSPNIVFDETGTFVIYTTLLGIKVVNVISKEVIRVLGLVENTERFVRLTLYQGRLPKIHKTTVVGDSKSSVDELDPMVIATAYKKNRFYFFSRREPAEMEDPSNYGRDIFNEKMHDDTRAAEAAAEAAKAKQNIAEKAIIYTTMGEIHVRLYPDECSRTVENFTTHSKNKYYDNILFHRVVKSFMIQTGDPQGDGTGGESIWGSEFEDECHPSLNHDEPFILAMANRGPHTNGSQFYISTVPCPWLNGKHTVFGKVTKGRDVVRAIESVRADKNNRPLIDVKMQTIKVITRAEEEEARKLKEDAERANAVAEAEAKKKSA